ncbi:LRR receptor-like serine/threonine-protein kinase [Tripterygium wilfordii]|uniref:LRR receptor-like serine/threonine-protein kinase n=1 Tax=Tripterygium wilfordii TaxID=458696 RepID=A0A7J7CWB6_TRIWF|nr:LRR receptor-like serine/threonine-protein kinase [Tripterygium wilfordii]
MRSQRVNNLCLWWRAGFLLFLIFVERCYGLNIDGVLLLAFKYSIIKDPTNVLESWNYDNDTPCSWKGVSCGSHPNTNSRVIGLALPSSQLLGSIPADFGMIEHLQNLDLSDNSLNGSLPFALFNATELRFLDLSNNLISGEVPETIGRLQNLQSLNLSDNALAGKIPATLTTVSNLTVVSLKNNYLSGDLPSRFSSLQVLDLSCNLINGSLPSDFGGPNLRYLNVSNNKLSGNIPPQFAEKIPGKATVDLSFNNLTGEIPESSVFMNQETKSFSGNLYLCGPPTKNLCPIPSTPSAPPNVSAPTSPPAFAAIPKTVDSSTSGNSSESQRSGLRPVTIIGIVIGDLTGTAILALIFCYLYHVKKKKKVEIATKDDSWSTSTSESRSFTRWSCLRKKAGDEKETGTSSSDSDNDHQNGPNRVESQRLQDPDQNKKGRLVTVDGEKELELETLLRASAYILGATGSSIMYKAVLEDGTSLAVRRIGENSVDRFKGFETQVRVIAKLVHPNLVHIRGFYWGVDEKLIIYDFVPNGSLANARHSDSSYKAGGSSRIFGSKRSTASRDSFQDFPMGPSPSPSPNSSSVGFGSPYHAPESLRNLKPNPKWDVYSFGVMLLELLTGKVIVVDEMGQVNGLVVEDKNRALRMADAAIRAELEGKEELLLGCFKLGYGCASPIPQKRPTMKEAIQILDKIPSSISSPHFYGHL